MSVVDQNEPTRPLNQKHMLAFYESMQKTLDSTRRVIEALQLSSNEKQLSNITQNGAMIFQDFKVDDLKVLEIKSVEKFIYQYERLSLQQKRDINFTQFVDLDLFVNTKGERKSHSHFKRQSSNDEPYLCNHRWFYGHRSFKCWMRLKLIRNGNKNPSSQSKPDWEVLRKRLLKWKENKKKGRKSNFKKPVEKSTFASNEVTPANEGAVEDVETDIIEVVPAGSVDEIFLSECTDVANAEVWDVAENEINHVEAELVLETRKGPMVVDGILDSGARKTSGARNLFKKFCWKIEDIKRKTFVRVASGNLYPVFKIGHLLPSVRIPGFGDYSLGPVAVLLVEQVNNWTKLLIGKEVLKLHGLDPTQILVRRLRNTGNGRSSKLTEKVEKSVKSFKETCEVNECITVEGAYLANWFKSKVFGDLEFDVVNTMEVNPHVFSEPGIENPLELQKGMAEAFAVEEDKISFEEGSA
eukprot:augustus_masked-scaffold_90-processed-gene-0.40-mRNA-1 protein AED:1.00 eAED:1.00 QI:0/0/0/0/1/1/2/0/468